MNKLDRHHIWQKGTPKGWKRKRYKKLLDDPSNIQIADHLEHMSGKVLHRTERDFLRTINGLKCQFCDRNFGKIGEWGCMFYEGYKAEDCRNFIFDLKKYEEVKDET